MSYTLKFGTHWKYNSIDKPQLIEVAKLQKRQLNTKSTLSVHSQKKGFFNGSSKWPKVLPGTFCYLNQAKGSQNYTQL